MRFTSLIVELIRARPRLVVWVVLLVQAVLWLALPIVFYGGPPGDVATVLAIGREYRVGTPDGPPLAFWFADLAFRLAGDHVAGVYLLAQVCVVAAFWALFGLGRAIVGGPHAVLAVLLTMPITAFAASRLAFGPDVLALPFWGGLLLQAWRVIGQRRRRAWFWFAVHAGLLVLTTSAAPALIAAVLFVMLVLPHGRRKTVSLEPLYALLVFVVIALPYALWMARNGGFAVTPPTIDDLQSKGFAAAAFFGGLVAATTGMIVLTMMSAARFVRVQENAPEIARAGIDPRGRAFVLIVALVLPLAACAIAGLYGGLRVAGGAGLLLLLSGLAVVVLSGDIIALRQQQLLRKVWALTVIAPALFAVAFVLIGPWIGGGESAATIPAKQIAAFFGDSYERRTGRPLTAVAGDTQFAALVALGKSRPNLLIDAQPERTPWLTPQTLIERGGLIVWRATDTIGTPPADIAQRFPGLVAEVPRSFDRMVNGRLPPLRIGWAIIRPR